MDRRQFIGKSIMASGAAALAACSGTGIGKTAGKADADKSNVGEMTFRTNPKTGEKVSILGYGCMRWPLTGEGVVDQEQVNRLTDRALEAGVTYFDTAPVYCKGTSERATGIALSRHRREEYTIATKMSNFSSDSWSLEESVKIYEKSFRELQVDYIDYYLLHSVGSGGMETLHSRFLDNGVLDFLLKEREKGRIRNLGFSFHGDVTVFDWLLEHHDVYKWDFVQIQMNYLDWDYAGKSNPRNVNASELFSKLNGKEIPVVIMEPLLGGRLSNVPQHIAEIMQEKEPLRSVASWAFRFCGSFPRVLTILSGMTCMEHLEDNLHTFCPLVPLNVTEEEFLKKIAGLMAEYPTIPCNNCAYCMPCPYGIDIPSILGHYNKCVNEGYIAESKESPLYRKLRRKYLSTYAKAVEDARAADKCIGCGQCVSKCPQRLDIPASLRKIDIYVEKLRRDNV